MIIPPHGTVGGNICAQRLRGEGFCAIIGSVMLKMTPHTTPEGHDVTAPDDLRSAAKAVSDTRLLPPSPAEVAGTTYGQPVSVPAAQESMPVPGDPGSGKGGTLLPVDYARYHDIARRLILQQTVAEIAADYGLTDRQIRRLLKKPEMLRIYRQVHDEMMSNLDALIKDEKVAPLLRARAQAVRMQTVLQEIVDCVQERVHDGRAKATEMKVAADVAFGLIDRAKIDISTQGPGGGGNTTQVNVALNVTGDGKRLIHETIHESGLDLSDVIDVDGDMEPSDAPATQDA